MEFAPLRKLAIRLACLHKEDRAWLLGQLGTAERMKLNELLDEIDELGLAADPAVVASVMAQPTDEAGLSAQGTAVKEMAATAEHPYWAALVIQGLDANQRRVIAANLPRSVQVKQFDNDLARTSTPPALVQALRTYLSGSGAKP